MQVEIEDSLYEEYQQLIRSRLADSVSSQLQKLILQELRSWAAPGHETDPLTGCKTRYQLVMDIGRATSVDGQVLYKSDFACLDIDDFKTYLDYAGIAPGDAVLEAIGKQLRETYSDANVYRFGGDEFVIELKGRKYNPVKTPSGISLKYSIVRVAATKDQRRNHYINRAIVFHLDKGIVEATQKGTEVACEIVTTWR